jgi:hypothetical protein
MHLPTFAPWRGDFESELLSFPNGRHDDQVDTVSQILNCSQLLPGPAHQQLWAVLIGDRRGLSTTAK